MIHYKSVLSVRRVETTVMDNSILFPRYSKSESIEYILKL